MYPNQSAAIVLSVVPVSVAGVRERTVRSTAATEAVTELVVRIHLHNFEKPL